MQWYARAHIQPNLPAHLQRKCTAPGCAVSHCCRGVSDWLAPLLGSQNDFLNKVVALAIQSRLWIEQAQLSDTPFRSVTVTGAFNAPEVQVKGHFMQGCCAPGASGSIHANKAVAACCLLSHHRCCSLLSFMPSRLTRVIVISGRRATTPASTSRPSNTQPQHTVVAEWKPLHHHRAGRAPRRVYITV